MTYDKAKTDSLTVPTQGIPSPASRTAEPRGGHRLPADTIVVSADNHWSIAEDIFVERFPAHLKERAPRLRIDDAGALQWEVAGKSMIGSTFQRTFNFFEGVPGCLSLAPRLRDMAQEGIDKEINFGNGINLFLAYPDLEVREWVFRIYNQHLSEMQQKAPGQFYGVGYINYWDMLKARDSIEELVSLGLKTFILPMNPKGGDDIVLDYCLPEMEPLWQAIEDSGLPLCFHVGEVFKDGPGGMGSTAMITFAPFRKTLGELIFGGIFDRHPSMKVVFAEADLNWVPGALQVAEMAYDCYSALLEPRIEHRPTYYWHKHCYATFMYDPVGMRMLDLIGKDRIMWTADYPHPESTFGYGWSAMEAVLDAVPEDDARMILGGTAMDLFNLER